VWGELASSIKIIANGWARLEELRKKGADSQQGFVAMWFDSRMTPIYNDVISKAIEDAGYKPHRVDKGEHNNKIDDEIIAQIRRSRFIVADFTGQRGGVYYEAGFAQGLGLEVFWTCRKDEIEKLHFDIRQYNCIVWEQDKPDEFRKRLANRIESVLGRGTYKQTAI
jgi:nucleoside 2-deoxyribosyltransferase